MSDLTDYRDHCRRMAAGHRPECPIAFVSDEGDPEVRHCGSLVPHEIHDYEARGLEWTCDGTCDGCVVEEHRRQFARQADEIDAYLGET